MVGWNAARRSGCAAPGRRADCAAPPWCLQCPTFEVLVQDSWRARAERRARPGCCWLGGATHRAAAPREPQREERAWLLSIRPKRTSLAVTPTVPIARWRSASASAALPSSDTQLWLLCVSAMRRGCSAAAHCRGGCARMGAGDACWLCAGALCKCLGPRLLELLGR